ncbi:MAG TPA: ABC transporter permease [Alphaproteobacteria bacterium]|jgi:ABC-2 type transport system permease protein|nr:ABC transporter permease [Alphaproteobacteria bacterium]
MDSLAPSESVIGQQPAPPAPRIMGRINWIGFWTLLVKEVRRFMKVYLQTIAAPVVTTLLYYVVFAVAMSSTGGTATASGQVQLFTFLAPGLIMMGMSQNAFANTSSSVMIGKVQGNIVDLLMTPISSIELALALVLGGVVRGLVVGVVTAIAIDFLVPVRIHDIFAVLGFAVLANMMLALLGVIGAIWADKFDHIAAVTNFVVMPLTFLSGTFYSVDRFRPAIRTAAHFNPFFYMIDGFRYGFIGHADAPLWLGVAVLVGVNAVLWLVTLRMLVTGYKLKS